MNQLPTALVPLAAYAQFLLYKAVPSQRRPGKVDKFPVSLKTGGVCDAHDQQHWGTAEQAIALCATFGAEYGVGFVFTANDPFFFLDIDDAAENGQWSSTAQDLLARFPGAAVELSHSGTGLHIFGRYSGAEPVHACKNKPLELELYTSGRFAALTGNGAVGDASLVCDAQLTSAIDQYFPMGDDDGTDVADFKWTNGPLPNSNPITSDAELIEKALGSKTASGVFGGGKATFRDLWERNVEALSGAFPDSLREYDESAADCSLASHLRFWTGGDCDRMERLMRMSALKRDKWDSHKSFMKRTFKKAFDGGGDLYNKGAPIALIKDDDEGELGQIKMKEGYQLMAPTQQVEFFQDCVYVASEGVIFNSSNGRILKQDQFNVMMGGYSFALDHELKSVTKKAWEAFTQSQSIAFPKVDDYCFDPQSPTGKITKIEGRQVVNTFVPVEIGMEKGDVNKFLTHLEKLLPNPRDREILLSYMSSCVRYAGHKIQWTVLVQGAEGNGKTLLTRCVAHALGKRYTHWPKAANIDSNFNSWLVGKLLIAVEDIRVQGHREDVLETLKPMITGGDGLEIEGKGVDQVSRDICANFMLNSNHKDAIRKTQNDRRYCVFYTNQQSKEDIIRDGMGPEYMHDLYCWLKGEGDYEGQVPGYNTVAHYLKYEFPIPDEFNPTGQCQRAPVTSSTDEAISLSTGAIEQEIKEAIAEGRQGFNGGWVSSKALDNLLNDIRRGNQVPRNKRRELMQSLGYDYHPALKDGRVNSVLPAEGGKPRLYIKDDHIHRNLTLPGEVLRTYCHLQGYGSGFGVDGNVSKG